MIWVQILWFIVTTVLSIALAPKPKGPRAAAIDDFQFPTAEEGRPVPVVFGTVDVTGPNVLWYGDLDIRKIKKKSMFSSTTVGYKYYIGFHMALSHGPVDAVTNITWGEKQAWSGNITSTGSGTVSQPDLFGGNSREGGVDGEFDVLMGDNAQTVNAYLLSQIGAPMSAYRGVLSFVWKGGYIGTTPYTKPLAVRVKRVLQGWSGSVWYPAKADVDGGMNGVHVLYECLTNPEWGMGISTADIDEDSFTEAADTLYTEGLGLNMMWSQAATIEDFLQIVMNHIAGTLVLRQDTGQYHLSLVRGDYDVDDLDLYDEDEVLSMDSYQRIGWGETVNEVTLVYTDPETKKDTSIVQQDIANIDAQGQRIAAVVELKGLQNHALARIILSRELMTRSTPLSQIRITVNRLGWNIPYGGLFKLNWEERDIEGTVYRVTSIRKGTLRNNTISIDAVEDIYALGVESHLGDVSVPTEVTPPTTPDDGEDTGPNVISTTTTAPPGSPQPQDGDRYYVPVGATGAWAGHAGEVAEWDEDEGEWTFITVGDGTIIYDQSTGDTYQQQGGALVPFGGGGGAITIIDPRTSPRTQYQNIDELTFTDADFLTASPIDGKLTVKVSPLTTKGDVYTRDASAVARLPVGTEGQYLRARAAESTGLKWEAAPPVGEGASAARAYKDTTQSIPDTTLTALTWGAEDFDTDAYHSTITNTSRFTAAVAGKYAVNATVQWDSNTSGARELYVVVNGATGNKIAGSVLPAAAGLVQNVVATLDLAANDYVEFYVRQTSGGARDAGPSASPIGRITVASISRVGVTAAPTLMRGATWVRSIGVIELPVNDVHVRCPVKGTIVGVTIGTLGGPGSCVVDIWKDTHANYPPAVADSITASAKPTISVGSKYEDTTLTGWNTAVAAGDWLVFHLDSSVTFSAIFVQLYIRETQ